ncbi:fatty acyl-CoA reductase wat isoform X2 [Diachasma alloeum]|nr:fatty acyl-CoA reductase wat isoform X2 [Diachasma alloeum]
MATPIQQFYAGQSVFITGGTGFLGKILIEKLLRSCPDISSIYLLVRFKKGQNVMQRMNSLFEDPVFQRLKTEAPKFRDKVVAVAGDFALPALGLSPVDQDLLVRNITIVFNIAATVRFNEKIKEAVTVNIKGPREVLILCRSMTNLRAVIHVSTAYSNCIRPDIEEKFYPSPISADGIMKLVDSVDESKLEDMTPSLLGNYPNSYTFTKQIAEQLVQLCGRDLPIGIYRPAVVVSSYKEPIEGWTDNVYGATGVIVGSASGLLRTLHYDINSTAELVPVDYTVNGLIATAWDVANNKNKAVDPPIYNYHSAWNNKLTWGDYHATALKYLKQMPSVKSHWCYSTTVASTPVIFYIYSMILHILPALLVDIGLSIIGRKTRAMKMYRNIHTFLDAINYFDTRTWKFSNENTRGLWENLTPEDKQLFPFSMMDFDWNDYLYKCSAGLRRYWFKDDPSTIPVAKKRMARILILHNVIKYSFLGLVCWILYRFFALVYGWGSTTISAFATT